MKLVLGNSMSCRPWMKFYCGDFLADTMDLTPEEVGMYILLLMHYWQKGMLQACSKHCSSIARAYAPESQASLNRILNSYFTEQDGRYVNKRMEREIKDFESKENTSKSNSSKASNAAKARWNNAPSIAPSIAPSMHTHNSSIAPSMPEVRSQKLEVRTLNHISQKTSEEVILPSDQNKIPNCPTQRIYALYRSILPELTDHRDKGVYDANLAARWRWVMAERLPEIMDDPPTIEDGMNYFKQLFEQVKESKFLMGGCPPRPGSPQFLASLKWIVVRRNFSEIIDGKYNREFK